MGGGVYDGFYEPTGMIRTKLADRVCGGDASRRKVDIVSMFKRYYGSTTPVMLPKMQWLVCE